MIEESDLQSSRNDFNEYDIIVYGTGLPESILSAACSRAGLSVLHLDSSDYYGSAWASFNLDQLMIWADSETRAKLEAPFSKVRFDDINLNHGEHLVFPTSHDDGFSSAEFDWLVEQNEQEPMEVSGENVSITPDPETSSQWTKAKICAESRRFCIDLTPQLLLSRGHAIDTMINSGVSRYGEYKLVDRILTFAENKLQEVPCTRSDVFQSDKISLLEKRMLMKFVNLCHNYDNERDWWQDYADQPFKIFLEQQNLSQLVKHYICHAVVDASDDTTTEGLKSARDFLDATGRYGNSPFLWPLYGCGELPQGFCRLSAVFGGTYCLRKRLQALVVDGENRVRATVFDNKRVTCNKNFICSRHMFSDDLFNSTVISRAVLITNKSILHSAKEHISYLNFWSEEDQKTVRLFEIGSGAMICPRGLYIVYLSTRFQKSARQDLSSAIDTLFTTTLGSFDKPDVLFQLFYTQRMSTSWIIDQLEPFGNFISTQLPSYNLHSERMFDAINKTFRKHFPDFELFPPAPDHQADDELELYSNPGAQADSGDVSNDLVPEIPNESN